MPADSVLPLNLFHNFASNISCKVPLAMILNFNGAKLLNVSGEKLRPVAYIFTSMVKYITSSDFKQRISQRDRLNTFIVYIFFLIFLSSKLFVLFLHMKKYFFKLELFSHKGFNHVCINGFRLTGIIVCHILSEKMYLIFYNSNNEYPKGVVSI